jgi:uncharacterized OB-fold protein
MNSSEYSCRYCLRHRPLNVAGICSQCMNDVFADNNRATIQAISKLLKLSTATLKRLEATGELVATRNEVGSRRYSRDNFEAYMKINSHKIAARLSTDMVKEERMEPLIDFKDTFFCKHCNKFPRIESGYCMNCLDSMISKSEAMRLFNLSLSQFDVLESQNYIKSYPFKTQKRYFRNEIHQAIYQTLGTDRKWSPTRTSCDSCGRIDKPHYVSGYCLDCYKNTLEYFTLKKFINGLSFADIGREKSVSRERIRQLFEKAISNEAENIFGEKYGEEDLAVIREETKKENKLNNARILYAEELLAKKDKAWQLVNSNKLTSAKALVSRLGMTAKAALILDETLPDVAEKLHANTNKWSFNYNKCIDCGTTEIPHRAKGLCESCYTKSDYHRAAQYKWRTNNYEHFREKQLQYEKEYYQRPEVKKRMTEKSYNKRYDGKREITIELAGYKCEDCGISRDEHKELFSQDLTVFHKNGDLSNNSQSNLAALCKRCLARWSRANILNQE